MLHGAQRGGAIEVDNGHVTFVLRRCAFIANTASKYSGGAINFDKSLQSVVTKISACTFENNNALGVCRNHLL